MGQILFMLSFAIWLFGMCAFVGAYCISCSIMIDRIRREEEIPQNKDIFPIVAIWALPIAMIGAVLMMVIDLGGWR